MTIHLCATCAVETEAAHTPDRICPICGDERQYLPKGGQRWTSVEALVADGHVLEWFEVEPEIGSAKDVLTKLKARGVLVGGGDGRVLRACTHLDVSAADAERAAEVIRRTLRQPVAV